jgi:hypothetical protein
VGSSPQPPPEKNNDVELKPLTHKHNHLLQQQLLQLQLYRNWLIKQGKTKSTVKYIVNYTKRFYFVLDTDDASPLITLSERNKQHALIALANYAKFTGRYDKFLQLRKRYNLKWSRGDPMKNFDRFFNEGLTLDIMLQRIRQMISLLPPLMGEIVKFACLVGLRASEVLEAVRLINNNQTFGTYYNQERQALEHFRFPSVFLRQTKKAYISFVSPEMVPLVVDIPSTKLPTLNAITFACRRKGIKMEMYLTRKIFASYLRKEGVEPEVVDLLQGRVSQSVLTRHYLTPSNDLKDRVLDSLSRLNQAISQQ